MTRTVYISRLRKLLDPFNTFDGIIIESMDWSVIKPQSEYLEEDERDTLEREEDYDAPRIKYFINQYKKKINQPEPPILYFVGPRNVLDVWDGYHRMCAAYIAGLERLKIEFYADTKEQRRIVERLCRRPAK